MIGKTIKTLLAASSTLTTLVGTRIYPYIMNPDTTLPAIAYSIDSLEPEYNKKEWATDTITFSIHCFSKDYAQLQSVVSAVRTALELKLTGYGSQDINRIYLRGQDEGFNLDEDAFYNRQIYELKINTY